MAITTIDGAIAGMQKPVPFVKTTGTMEATGIPHSNWYAAGTPGAGSAPSSGINGGSHSSTSALVAGQLYHADPVSGNAYLARLSATSSVTGTLLLCDRLWSNSGLSVTSTTAQAITPASLPARDRNGTTDGDDVLFAIEWSAAGGAGTPTVTLTYTDQDGNTGATGTFVGQATPAVGTFEIFSLAAGDLGVRAPTSFIQSATRTSGTMHLVGFRILATLEVTAANIGNAVDALTSGMPQLYNGTVPFLVWIPTATTSGVISGTYIETHG